MWYFLADADADVDALAKDDDANYYRHETVTMTNITILSQQKDFLDVPGFPVEMSLLGTLFAHDGRQEGLVQSYI